MPTFYEVRHYNSSARNYNTFGHYTSREKAESIAEMYLAENIGTNPQIRQYHKMLIFKWEAFAGIYKQRLINTIE